MDWNSGFKIINADCLRHSERSKSGDVRNKKRLVLIVQEAEGYPGKERAVVLGEGHLF